MRRPRWNGGGNSCGHKTVIKLFPLNCGFTLSTCASLVLVLLPLPARLLRNERRVGQQFNVFTFPFANEDVGGGSERARVFIYSSIST